jgi:hypothetical protein
MDKAGPTKARPAANIGMPAAESRANAAIVNGGLSGDGAHRVGARGTWTPGFQKKYRKSMEIDGYLVLRKLIRI